MTERKTNDMHFKIRKNYEYIQFKYSINVNHIDK